MEEVSRQFGADGVEIDAHMLCAEDHLPYQGGQYSNADFEMIQDSLPRPFGEWNCRHSWHGIMLGISPPAFTPEQLQEYREYSTEQIEIDEKTQSRYQWSQQMRRIETAVREQKDTAILAEAAGDDTLRRQCQNRISALNDKYAAICRQTGLEPEYTRTNVFGFKDYNTGNDLTEKPEGGTMASDSSDHWHPITPESIQSVPLFTEFETKEINEAVHNACTEILNDLINDPVGTEEAISISLSDLRREKRKGEPGEGAVDPPNLNESYISVHNHPSNETFSYNDVDVFGSRFNCYGIVVIGNNGYSTYSLIKDESFDRYGFSVYRALKATGLSTFKSKDEFLKGARFYGVRYTRTD